MRSPTDGGSYADPATGGPLTENAPAGCVTTLLGGFPDRSFELVSVAATGVLPDSPVQARRDNLYVVWPYGPDTGQLRSN